MGVNPKIGVFTPQTFHLLIGFSIINHPPFWGTSLFGNTHMEHEKRGLYVGVILIET